MVFIQVHAGSSGLNVKPSFLKDFAGQISGLIKGTTKLHAGIDTTIYGYLRSLSNANFVVFYGHRQRSASGTG